MVVFDRLWSGRAITEHKYVFLVFVCVYMYLCMSPIISIIVLNCFPLVGPYLAIKKILILILCKTVKYWPIRKLALGVYSVFVPTDLVICLKKKVNLNKFISSSKLSEYLTNQLKFLFPFWNVNIQLSISKEWGFLMITTVYYAVVVIIG